MFALVVRYRRFYFGVVKERSRSCKMRDGRVGYPVIPYVYRWARLRSFTLPSIRRVRRRVIGHQIGIGFMELRLTNDFSPILLKSGYTSSPSQVRYNG